MLKQLRQFIADTFAIGYNEAKGVLLLILLIVLFLVSPLLYRRFWPASLPSTAATDQQKLDSLLVQMNAAGAAEDRERGSNNRNGYASRGDGDKRTAEHYQEVKPFPFDPNTVSVAGWQQLGLPRWMAERIDKFRSKGGQFRKKEDLLRIYDFPPEAYEQLEPYIQLPNAGQPTNGPGSFGKVPNATTGAATAPANTPARERYVKPVIQPFDINTADTTQLIALKGIGSKLATRIVQYRDDLGGFLSPDQ